MTGTSRRDRAVRNQRASMTRNHARAVRPSLVDAGTGGDGSDDHRLQQVEGAIEVLRPDLRALGELLVMRHCRLPACGIIHRMLTPAEMDVIAKDIDRVTEALSKLPVLRAVTPQGCAMALALAAANHVLHAGGSQDDFMNLVRAAWTKARQQHDAPGKSSPPRCRD